MQSLFLAARQLFSVFFQDLRDQDALIHEVFFPFDLLVIFMAFSGQYNNVSRFSMVDGIGNCFLTVADLHIFSTGFCNSGLNIVYDLLRILNLGYLK